MQYKEHCGQILVADLHEGFVARVERLCGSEGWLFACATSSNKVCAELANQLCSVLIASPEFDERRDLGIVRQAREIIPNLPVIVVTDFPTTETATLAVDLRATAYLAKSVDDATFVTRVGEAMRQSESQRMLATIRQRLEHCAHDLKNPSLFASRPDARQNGGTPLSTFTIRTLALCLSEMLKLESVAGSEQVWLHLCDLLECPRKPLVQAALRETIEVLEETKTKFKSKQLMTLRTKLEGFLRKPSDLMARTY